MMRSLIGISVLALTAAACGGSGTPDGPATTLAAPATTIVTSSTAGTSSTAPTTAPPTTTSAAPRLGVELLVAGPDGVSLVDAEGEVSVVVSGPAAAAIDDLNGGVLFQVERWSRDRRSVVYRIARGSSEAAAILIPTFEQGLVLNGVARDGDDTTIFYTRSEGSTPEDAKDTFRRYSVATREVTEVSVVGGWESLSYPISISESLILFNWAAEIYHGMTFTDLDGNGAAVAADPDPPDGFEDCGPCPRLGELSTDGGQLVYAETVDFVTYAVIRHVASGAEIRRIELDRDGWGVLSFDLGRDHLVVNRDSNDGVLEAFVYDLSLVKPEPVEVPVRGEAYLTRSPVDMSGPVPAP